MISRISAFSILLISIAKWFVSYKIQSPVYSIGTIQLFYSARLLRRSHELVLIRRNIHKGIALHAINGHLIQDIHRILIGSILRRLDNNHEILRIGPPLLVQD